jgi:hypothetical protein
VHRHKYSPRAKVHCQRLCCLLVSNVAWCGTVVQTVRKSLLPRLQKRRVPSVLPGIRGQQFRSELWFVCTGLCGIIAQRP